MKFLKCRGTFKNHFFRFSRRQERTKNAFSVSLHVFRNFIFFLENHDFHCYPLQENFKENHDFQQNMKFLKLGRVSKNHFFSFILYKKHSKNAFIVSLHVFMNFIFFLENHDFHCYSLQEKIMVFNKK